MKMHVADAVAALDLERDRLEVRRVLAAEIERLDVGVEQLLLALVLLAEELLDFPGRCRAASSGRRRR
jgi:hypothetical protein